MNDLYNFHFYFNYHIVYFQLKVNSVGITEVSIVPMADNMYFIQWITTPNYEYGYKFYTSNLYESKLRVSNRILIFCPDSIDVSKYNYVTVKLLI